MSSYRKFIFIIGVLLGFAGLLYAQNSQQQYYNSTGAWSGAAEICHKISQVSGNPSLDLYGVHVSNTSGSSVYVAIFPNTSAQPSNGVVIPGGGWLLATAADIDINTVNSGISNAAGSIEVCLSTTQGTFTAATAVGYFWILYKGTAATPTSTSTFTPTATPT